MGSRSAHSNFLSIWGGQNAVHSAVLSANSRLCAQESFMVGSGYHIGVLGIDLGQLYAWQLQLLISVVINQGKRFFLWKNIHLLWLASSEMMESDGWILLKRRPWLIGYVYYGSAKGCGGTRLSVCLPFFLYLNIVLHCLLLHAFSSSFGA